MPWWGLNTPDEVKEIDKSIIIEDIAITTIALGRGSYGSVFAAIYEGKPCVAKEMHPHLNESDKQNHPSGSSPRDIFIKEINTLYKLRHPSIVQFLGVYFKNDSCVPILVMERLWKNLSTLLQEQQNRVPLFTKAHILHDVACGLQYLHNQEKPVIHRDINGNNILLNEHLEAKIVDLGQAKALESLAGQQKLTSAPGNLAHMPPETLKNKPIYDTKLDVFSFGCTIIHLVTERFPTPTDQFIESEDFNSYIKVSEYKRREEFLEMMNSNLPLRKIAIDCLEDMPADRPTASSICSDLEQYIHQLEVTSPRLAEQYKQDKLFLLHLIQTQQTQLEKHEKVIVELNKVKMQCDATILKKGEELTLLKSQFLESKSKLEEKEKSYLKCKQEKESLEKDVANLNKTNEQLTITYNNQTNFLKEDVKAKQKELKTARHNNTEMQKEINKLKQNLKSTESMLLQEKQKINELQNNVQMMKDKADSFKQENDQLSENNNELTVKIKESEENYSKLQCELEEKIKCSEALATEQKTFYTETLKNQEHKLNDLIQEVRTYKDYKSKYTDVQQKYTDVQQKYTDLTKRYTTLQENFKKTQVEETQVGKKITDTGSKLHKQLLEVQSIKEKEYQHLEKQRQLFHETFMKQDAKVSAMQFQLVKLNERATTQKQQLEEKSYRLSTLESSLNELQELYHSKEEKLKTLEDQVTILNKQLENSKTKEANLEKDVKSKEESLKRKEVELQLQKKEHADEISNLQDQHRRKIKDLHKDIETYKSQIINEKEINILNMKEVQYKSDLEKNTMEKFKILEDELKSYIKTEKNLKRQIKHKDADIKEKTKHIESLGKNSSSASSGGYNFDFYWYPYLSLPIKRTRPSATIVKDKVFVTSGYQSTNPQGQEIESYFKCSEVGDEVFFFYTGKCQWGTIASPVQLGALASVNGQCVLVSGADIVGNTLTGNVYVLCEEGSHDQWKKFSKSLPTPRILACACCYKEGKEGWLMVCGGYTSKTKEESYFLEAITSVEILNIAKEEWYTLSEGSLRMSTILCCAVIGEEMYVVGSDQVIKTSCNKLIKAATSNNTLVWDNVEIETEESNGKLYPFSVVEVNGEPMIIASMSDGEDDVTCVLMKDTRGRWRIMSKAVECQHCSAAVMTSSLELLLFGGSEKISVDKATDMSLKSTLIPTLDVSGIAPMRKALTMESLTFMPNQSDVVSSDCVPVTVNQPTNVSFTGPIHTAQFDHNGGTFQSPIHKVSLVVSPNALSDGEKVTVYMGATTSGPFDLPEDCKLRSAVVWLSVSPSDVVFKRSVSVIVPHSAVFTSPQHHSMMRFVACGDYKSCRYRFSCSQNEYEIDGEQGLIRLNKFAMFAIIATSGFAHYQENEGTGSDDSNIEFLDTSNRVATDQNKLQIPPACYLAKLFWPCGELPSSFRVDIYCLQNLPTEIYKVNHLYRKAYYEENGAYPEVVEIEFMISSNGASLQCVLPCDGSTECDCLSNWDVIPLTDLNVYLEKDKECYSQYSVDLMRFSFKFNCLQPNATCSLTSYFELHGVDLIKGSRNNHARLPPCLQGRPHPFVLEKGVHCGKTEVSPTEEKPVLSGSEIQNDEGLTSRSYQPTDII